MADRLEPLLAWALGAFHAALLMALAVLLLHLGGGLGSFLGGLSTLLGIGLYLALWAAMWLIARWVTNGVAWTSRGPAEEAVLLNGSLLAGGALGASLVVGAVLVTALPFALQQGLGSAGGVLVLAVVGGGFAFVGGAMVGGLLAGLDLLLLRVARRALG